MDIRGYPDSPFNVEARIPATVVIPVIMTTAVMTVVMMRKATTEVMMKVTNNT